MLLRFSISNFLSFKKKQEFNMFARRETVHSNLLNKIDSLRVLNYSSIHGSNAAGKSNLIKAIDCGRIIILKGLDSTHIVDKYHKFNNMKNEESYFDYEIEINGSVYAYGFRIILSKKQVLSEWLYKLGENGNDKLIFTRDLIKKEMDINIQTNDSKVRTKVRGWLDDSLHMENELFLKSVILKNRIDIDGINIFNDIYNWFNYKLVIMYPNTKIRSFDFIVNNRFNIADMICKLDTGITSISKKRVSREYLPEQFNNDFFDSFLENITNDLHENNNKPIGLSDGINLYKIFLEDNNESLIFEKMVFSHVKNDSSEMLELHEESDGTRRMIDILMYMTNAKEKGQTLIIDEIERSLHPNLVKELINYYANSKKNDRTQLIYTTHDENFIDLSTYRKDTIWFVDKTNEGESELSSLDEFNVRSDRKKVKNDYLEGRFGGVPILSALINYCDEDDDANER